MTSQPKDDAPWFPYASTVVEMILLVIHLSVFACVARSVRKKAQYASGAFFKIFLMKCVGDYVAYALGTVVWRLTQVGVITSIDSMPVLILINYLLIFALFFQTTADTVISATRYTALAHPTYHLKLWTGSRLRCVLVSVVAVPTIVAVVCTTLLFASIFEEAVALVNTMAVLSASFTSGCGLASAMMAFRALYLYKKLARRRQREHREDYRLLVYAILSLLAQVALSFFNAIDVLIPADDNNALGNFVQSNFPYLVAFISLTSPLFLLSTCKSVRMAYGRMFCGCFVPDSSDSTTSLLSTNSGSSKQTVVFVTQVKPLDTQDRDAYGFRGRRVNTM